MKKFAEYDHFDLSEINQEVLGQWDKENVFEQSMTTREGCPSYVFYEGPPSANGMPGIHHVMARTIKDTFCRYKTMRGYQVKRKAGWDTHGLPVELGVEKALGITKEDIGRTISVADYNAACRKDVMKYTKEWTDLTHRMGYWVDLDNPYITYDNRYIETLWWLLKQLYNKGLLYKGYTIQPYSPAAGTGLSSHELNQPGCYRDVKDTTVVAQFRMTTPRPEMEGWGTPCFIAWTTTPWTLPSNTALCVGPKIDYVAVRSYNGYTGEKITAVLAKALLHAHFNPKAEGLPLDSYKAGDKLIPYEIVGEYKGTDLVGMRYEQLFPWVKPVKAATDGTWVDASGEAFRVIAGDYVTTDDGTGIVHIAPTFGADDAYVAKAAGIPSLFVINRRGEARPMVDFAGKFYLWADIDDDFARTFIQEEAYRQYAGRWVKNAYDPQFTVGGKYDEKAAAAAESLDISLCMEMKATGRAFKIEKHVHNYPHCWRTDKPVLYYPLDSWFIRSTAAKERMMELNKTINWKPESTGTGRFGKWLENLNDWNLSRSRYWGTPLPIWRSESGEERCVGSVEELFGEIDKAVAAGVMATNPYRDRGFVPGDYSRENYERIDLHRPYVDDIVLVSDTGQPMHREADLIDVWFDSGSMPYAQLHYPFENRDAIDAGSYYPADFIAEGVDQTRGWFFTLHAIATMVFDSVAYRNVISNGLVLDKNGNKMSKRLGNAVDPFGAIEKYGSDPVRWYMITNSAPWDNLKFDADGVEEVRRKFFGTLYNTYSFFALYANVDEYTGAEAVIPVAERPEIDRWVISELNSLTRAVTAAYDAYEPTTAGRLIQDFVSDNLSNWYVRLNRKRFWGGGLTADKLAAYQTLHACLTTVARLMAPIAPFYADRLWRDLTAAAGSHEATSVHLATFPTADTALIDTALERKMELAQAISSMVLALRKQAKIIVRQPLQTLMFPAVDAEQQADVEAVKKLILSEVNVKELRIADASAQVLVKRVKPNFRELGKRYGKLMKPLANALADLAQADIATLEQTGEIGMTVEGQEVVVNATDVEIVSEDMPGWLVAHEGRVTVALDIHVTDDLRREGIARDLVKRIQNYRKTSGLEITDRVSITLASGTEADAAVEQFKDYIATQVLASSITVAPTLPDGKEATDLDMDGYTIRAVIEK